MKRILYTLAVLLLIQVSGKAQNSYTDKAMGFTISMPDGWDMKTDSNCVLRYTNGQDKEMLLMFSSDSTYLNGVDSVLYGINMGFQKYINYYKQQGISTSYKKDSTSIQNIPFKTMNLKLGMDTNNPMQIEVYYMWEAERFLLGLIRYKYPKPERDIMYKAFADAVKTMK